MRCFFQVYDETKDSADQPLALGVGTRCLGDRVVRAHRPRPTRHRSLAAGLLSFARLPQEDSFVFSNRGNRRRRFGRVRGQRRLLARPGGSSEHRERPSVVRRLGRLVWRNGAARLSLPRCEDEPTEASKAEATSRLIAAIRTGRGVRRITRLASRTELASLNESTRRSTRATRPSEGASSGESSP